MSKILFALALIAAALFGTYYAKQIMEDRIDSSAAVVIETTLADNAIYQLRVLSEIRDKIQAEDLSGASSAVSEAIETNLYILEQCEQPRCRETVEAFGSNH